MDGPGRPRLFKDHESFASAAKGYFASLEGSDKMPTLAGLCLFMGFHDKESFGHYANYGDEYSRTVKGAKLRIEEDRNQRLANPSCTGIIFDLKNNHGWRDKTETELTGAEGGPVRTEAKLNLSDLTDDQLRVLASIKV